MSLERPRASSAKAALSGHTGSLWPEDIHDYVVIWDPPTPRLPGKAGKTWKFLDSGCPEIGERAGFRPMYPSVHPPSLTPKVQRWKVRFFQGLWRIGGGTARTKRWKVLESTPCSTGSHVFTLDTWM